MRINPTAQYVSFNAIKVHTSTDSHLNNIYLDFIKRNDIPQGLCQYEFHSNDQGDRLYIVFGIVRVTEQDFSDKLKKFLTSDSVPNKINNEEVEKSCQYFPEITLAEESLGEPIKNTEFSSDQLKQLDLTEKDLDSCVSVNLLPVHHR
jgi:hypothetical protein